MTDCGPGLPGRLHRGRGALYNVTLVCGPRIPRDLLQQLGHDDARAALSPKAGQKTCDVTVDDGRLWAVFEVTSCRLTRESMASTSAERLNLDFTKLLKKVHQLDATITSLRVREAVLTGGPTPPSPRRGTSPC